METKKGFSYADLLAEAGKFHGDICAGIEIGTKMTICGLNRIGITDPKGADKKKLIVFVEIDRCSTDAIMAITGCRPGKRSMKVLDYGKMAATFINIETGKAVRVAAKMSKKDGAENPDFGSIHESDLFSIEDVSVALKPEDMPGKPLRRVICDNCRETIMDGRETIAGGKIFCKTCFSGDKYYEAEVLANPYDIMDEGVIP